MSYDIECYALARRFLDDCKQAVTEQDREALAQRIQDAVEEWLDGRFGTDRLEATETLEETHEIDVRDVRVGDCLAVWWGDGWARIISLALRPEGDIAVLFEDGTADVVLSLGPSVGCHVVRGPRGPGPSVADLLTRG